MSTGEFGSLGENCESGELGELGESGEPGEFGERGEVLMRCRVADLNFPKTNFLFAMTAALFLRVDPSLHVQFRQWSWPKS